MCSYITLPLYALLAQGGKSPSPATAHSGSTGRTLHRFKTTGHSHHSPDHEEDNDASDYDADAQPHKSESASLIIRVNQQGDKNTNDSHHDEEASREADFSFAKPAPQRDP
ncbi:hypothetical protein SAY86_031555 [Trapa natans]|uniref:Uncharacterized protein n=1 Tax=Trapa natans TaxID=22666 RepID=A0AAN7LS56_TRANT|nr:hypothetical protein SAY86_031555 [Trapa natans]